MTKQPHKLEALRLLKNGMAQVEAHREVWIKRGDDPAQVDRACAQIALTGIMTFCLDTEIEVGPISRLLAEIAALSDGVRLSNMLIPAVISHRPPTPPTIEMIKGRLAAIMEFRQRSGSSRKSAATWVIHHMPSKMKRDIGAGTAAAIDKWLTKWGGTRGATAGPGRDGYLAMQAILERVRPSETQLKGIVKGLARWVPSREST